MRLRTSFFNKTVFCKTVSRFWPLWLSYVVLWFMLLPMALINRFGRGDIETVYIKSDILEMAAGASGLIVFVFSALTAMAVFGWLYQSRSVGFMAALPVRRETMFLSSYAAGLSMLLLGNVIIFLISCLSLAVNGVNGVAWLAQCLAVTTLDVLNFYGFAVLCAMLTGNLVILPLVYTVLQCTATVVEAMVGYILSSVVYGLPNRNNEVLSFLSPIWARVRGVHCRMDGYADPKGFWRPGDYYIDGWEILIIYATVGVLFTLLALWLYKRRRMETASDAVAIEILKPTFRICLSVGCALCAAAGGDYLIHTGSYISGDWPRALLLLCLLLLGCVVGWFAADMLIYKSFSVFRRHIRGLLLVCAVLTVLTLGCEADVLGVEKRVPDVEDFDMAYLHCAGENIMLESEKGREALTALHESIVVNKDLHESGARLNCRTLQIEYVREVNGREKTVMSRRYNIASTPDQAEDPLSDLRAVEAIFNERECIVSRKQVPFEVTEQSIVYAALEQNYDMSKYETTAPGAEETRFFIQLTDAEAYELYTTCILPDIADGTLGRIWLVEDENYARSIYNLRIGMAFEKRSADGSEEYSHYFYTVPTTESQRTNAWLTEHGVELETLWEAMERAGEAEMLAGWKTW